MCDAIHDVFILCFTDNHHGRGDEKTSFATVSKVRLNSAFFVVDQLILIVAVLNLKTFSPLGKFKFF